MKGYVQNLGTNAFFILQRQVPPGGKVRLQDAFRTLHGNNVELTEDKVAEFIELLKTKMPTNGTWGYFDESGVSLEISETSEKPVALEKSKSKNSSSPKTSSKKEDDARGAGRNLHRDSDSVAKGTEITAATIIQASYDEARTLIESTRDRVVLKKALGLTKHFSGKEQHMRHILKRLEQTV